METTVSLAETSLGERKFLLIGEMESPTLTNDLSDFSANLRETVKNIRDGLYGASGGTRTPIWPDMARLREYFDEFSGQREIKASRTVIADCYHGNVVAALRRKLKGRSQIFKNRDVDLVTLKGRNASLFEVKTAADTQSVYTAVGQLAVHSLAVSRYLGRVRVVSVIVLPDRPAKRLGRVLTDKLNIHVVTYTRSQRGHFRFLGLDELR